jgi:hypothetical protein
MRKNVLVSHGVAGALAGGGAVIATVTVFKALALGLAGALPVALPVAGAAAALGYGLYRYSSREALRGAEKEIRTMLQAVASSLRAQQVFGVAPPPPVPPRDRSAGDDFLLLGGS